MDYFFSAVITLLLVMDPFGNIPLFITALEKVPQRRRKTVLLRELFIALVIMVVFMYAGERFLDYMDIKDYSLEVAGGIILFLISIKLVFGGADETKSEPKEEPLIVPLAIPLVAGPAALSFTIILSAQMPDKWVLLLAILCASVLNSLILLLSLPISRHLGKRGLTAVERLTGMLLTVMAVNMVMTGIAEFIKR